MIIEEVNNAIPDGICDKIINTFKNELEPATIYYSGGGGGDHKAILADDRVALNTFFDEKTFPEILPLKKKISEITNLPLKNQELFNLIRYDKEGKYDQHYDSCIPSLSNESPRVYSFIFYLNDDFKGGGTHFPNLDGKTIIPKKGKMVYWKNVDNQQNFDYDSLHSGLPVEDGVKWILTMWVRDENINNNSPKDPLGFVSEYAPLLENYGYTVLKVPDPILKYIKYEVNKLQNNFSKSKKYNEYLAGEIKNEYMLPIVGEFFNPFLKRAVFDFEMKSNYLSSKVPNNIGKEFQFNNTWINYQKKTEYNPVHHHSGVYSYVIWYQIPYYLKDEQQLSHTPEDKITTNGNFMFHYPKMSEFDEPLVQAISPLERHIDKNFEGYMAIFPSTLTHSVNPFYSTDEFRISISGNVSVVLGPGLKIK